MRPLHHCSLGRPRQRVVRVDAVLLPRGERAARLVAAAAVDDDRGVAAPREPDAPADEALARRLVRRPLHDRRQRARRRAGGRRRPRARSRRASGRAGRAAAGRRRRPDQPCAMRTARGSAVPAKWQAARWPSPSGFERRLVLGADRLRDRAARAEAAAARRVHRARHVARQHDARASSARAAARDRREQRHRVRVQRPREELGRRRELDDLAEVHHRDRGRRCSRRPRGRARRRDTSGRRPASARRAGSAPATGSRRRAPTPARRRRRASAAGRARGRCRCAGAGRR